jgi:hypothetical protein
MNVVSIEAFESARQFEAHFRSLPRVILEGRSDVELFTEWFEHLLADLDFVPAEALIDGGGCTAVLPAVIKSRDEDEVPAVGIVDRDRLQRDKRWDVLFSLDDGALEGVAEDPDVYTTSLWETEAYLLRPELLSKWVGVQRKPPPATRQEKEAALANTLRECETLLEAIPFFSSAHGVGEPCDPAHSYHIAHNDMPQHCAAGLDAAVEERRALARELEAMVAKIREAAPSEAAERLLFLLRYVDTKRLLARLERHLGLQKESHHSLSVLMSMANLRPAELERFLERTVERFAA